MPIHLDILTHVALSSDRDFDNDAGRFGPVFPAVAAMEVGGGVNSVFGAPGVL